MTAVPVPEPGHDPVAELLAEWARDVSSEPFPEINIDAATKAIRRGTTERAERLAAWRAACIRSLVLLTAARQSGWPSGCEFCGTDFTRADSPTPVPVGTDAHTGATVWSCPTCCGED